MKKIRKHINKYKKTSVSISLTLILFSLFLIYLDYRNTQNIYKSIKKINFVQLEKDRLLERVKQLDLKTDTSITKFVNNKIAFESLDYIPNNLEYIKSDYVFDTKWYWQLKKEANIALQKLARDFYLEFDKKLKIVSSYRSYYYQKGIKDNWCPDNLCAKAWYSEHQTWLVIDIFSASTLKEWQTNKDYIMYFDWFKNNAYKYWFHNTYQKWLKIDWYEIEPWHWRYLWLDLSIYLYENNITFAEYYNSK